VFVQRVNAHTRSAYRLILAALVAARAGCRSMKNDGRRRVGYRQAAAGAILAVPGRLASLPAPAGALVTLLILWTGRVSTRSVTGLGMRLETYKFVDDGRIPNSVLPVLIYHDALDSHAGAPAYEELFASHGWLGAWRDGMFGFHHFHSTTHEVLGIAAGRAHVLLGGPRGHGLELRSGDVAALPAGTGHCNAGSGPSLLVVGAYPNGMRWDLRRGGPGEHEEVRANIARVPVPDQDPVHLGAGPLRELWSRAR